MQNHVRLLAAKNLARRRSVLVDYVGHLEDTNHIVALKAAEGSLYLVVVGAEGLLDELVLGLVPRFSFPIVSAHEMGRHAKFGV